MHTLMRWHEHTTQDGTGTSPVGIETPFPVPVSCLGATFLPSPSPIRVVGPRRVSQTRQEVKGGSMAAASRPVQTRPPRSSTRGRTKQQHQREYQMCALVARSYSSEQASSLWPVGTEEGEQLMCHAVGGGSLVEEGEQLSTIGAAGN
jgi:hypothetical protein